MTRPAGILAAAAAVLAWVAAASTARAAPVAAVVGPDGAADVRTAILVGPSGQVYAGDGAGTWKRTVAGGVAADVSSATRLGRELLVAGATMPMYRFDGTRWTSLRIGQSGKTILGRGPVPTVAIGRHVFVHATGVWTRVGQAPGPVTAVWASSPTKVFVVTAAGVHALRGAAFVRIRPAVGAIVGTGAWGIGATGAVDVTTGRQVVTARGAVAATGGAGTPWLLVPNAGTLELVGRVAGKPKKIPTPLPASTVIVGIAADRAGRMLVVTDAGAIHVFVDGAWATGTMIDSLPAKKPGPGPAPTR